MNQLVEHPEAIPAWPVEVGGCGVSGTPVWLVGDRGRSADAPRLDFGSSHDGGDACNPTEPPVGFEPTTLALQERNGARFCA